MCASKTVYAAADPSTLHLPTVPKKSRRRLRHSPTSSAISVPATTVSTNVSENVSALKAKYAGYATWLKASAGQNREPVYTHELLKHSLCQMGIDSTQATQLVSTCTWYVYQFQKGLGSETEQHDQPTTTTTTTTDHKKSPQSAKKRVQRNNSVKLKRTVLSRDHSSESETTLNSISKENLLPLGSRPVTTRNKFSVLPAIYSSDSSISPRSRRVDFDHEESPGKQKTLHQRSAVTKTRVLPKLQPLESESTSSINVQSDIISESITTDVDLTNSTKNLRRTSLVSGHTRSILRKQTSTNSSLLSTDVNGRRYRHKVSTPTSTFIDEVPLGTKSQRLFGGSEFFAQIMNELEEQTLY